MQCEICGADCREGVADWHYECPSCGTERSTLRPSINSGQAQIVPEEKGRVRGLEAMRAEGYQRALGALQELRGNVGGSLLEVGSAYGWFLVAARPYFQRVVGIEPDDSVRTVPEATNAEV